MSGSLITGDAGRICFLPAGKYDSSATYNFLDFVYYEGAAYVAKKETTGNAPAENNEFWQILAGLKASGVTGVKGEKETEYRVGDVNITAADVGALSLDSGNNVIARSQYDVIRLKNISETNQNVGINFYNKDAWKGEMWFQQDGSFRINGKDAEGNTSVRLYMYPDSIYMGKPGTNTSYLAANANGVYHFGKKLYEEGDSPVFHTVTVKKAGWETLSLHNTNAKSSTGIAFYGAGRQMGVMWVDDPTKEFRVNIYGEDGSTVAYFKVNSNGMYHSGMKLYEEGDSPKFNDMTVDGTVSMGADARILCEGEVWAAKLLESRGSANFHGEANFKGTWAFKDAYNGTFKTGDNKTVTVTNGIITGVQ